MIRIPLGQSSLGDNVNHTTILPSKINKLLSLHGIITYKKDLVPVLARSLKTRAILLLMILCRIENFEIGCGQRCHRTKMLFKHDSAVLETVVP